ncbi:MAG TPA: hypothetical protein VI894_00230 [Candidatus Nanoarchaeia archaeon]|nr:hypothetical protein [Candidatus Nanoarchaeia archaeon]
MMYLIVRVQQKRVARDSCRTAIRPIRTAIRPIGTLRLWGSDCDGQRRLLA